MYRTRNLSNIKTSLWKGPSRPTSANKIKLQQSFIRNSSSASKSSSGSGAYIGGTFAVIGLLGGGTAAYAKYDETFRKNLEETAPFVKPIFNGLLGTLGTSKSNLDPLAEKDLSIPFTVDQQEVAKQPEDASTPLFADNITTSKKEESGSSNIVAINVLDAPAVSSIDLDISNMGSKKKQKEDVTKPTEKSSNEAKTKENFGSSNIVAINVLDSPGVSSIDLDISNMGTKEKDGKVEKVEETKALPPDTAGDTSSTTVENTNDDVTSEKNDVINENVVASTEELNKESINETIITPVEDTPLTKAEIQDLSGIVDQGALEVVLDATKDYISILSDEVIDAQKKAVDTVRGYISHYAQFIAGDSEEQETLKNKLVEIEGISQTVIDKAVKKEVELKKEFENFKELIDSVKKSGASEFADKAENLLNECSVKLNNAITELDKINKELGFVSKIETAIKEFPENIKNSVKKFTPELLELIEKYGSEIDFDGLKPEEAIMGYVLKKSEQLQLALNDKSVVDVKRMEEILEEQKEKILKESEERFIEELKKIETENMEAQEIKMKQLQEDYEKEILSQLKRQASAHNEHLMDELSTQASNLISKHQNELNKKVTELREANQLQLEKNLACIHGIQNKISEVVDTDKKQRRVQELWIASQALYSGLKEALAHGRTRTLMPEMLSVLQLGGQNKAIEEIVDSFPESAATIGVIPEKELLSRFKHVKKACKKVAMVGEEGGAIPTYALSYLKSLFMFSAWYRSNFENEVDLNRLDPYEILAKAEHYALEGDLEQTAKFMSQLKGAPRKLCSDWLRETRLFLETKQTANLLMAYAASLSVAYE